MKFHQYSTVLLGIFGTFLSLSTSAQAASFQSNVTVTDGTVGDIWLNSITQNGVTFNNFSFVKEAKILNNTPIVLSTDPAIQGKETSTPGQYNNNTGAMSTEKGDKATSPLPVSGLNNPTGAEIAAFLGNNNLSNIIDTEDWGPVQQFTLNLTFDSVIEQDGTGLDSLFFWERGMENGVGNSDLGVQALDENGNLVGNFITLDRNAQTSAGYSIDTTEIGGAQGVGSWGVSLKQLGVTSFKSIQLVSKSTYNGPDFKVIARTSANTAKTPEPGTLLGLGAIFGTASLVNRRKQNKTRACV
ncbi:hypothetical protein NUACC21_63180 [Scytonema sp. NUACC21]